jgi:hypothetical protein
MWPGNGWKTYLLGAAGRHGGDLGLNGSSERHIGKLTD